MANVFLSYDRDDGARARSIASALEKAGHSVWWDKHIGGGTEYAREIEQALSNCDVVVVLWSSSSIVSPWVRDEAGTGRDRGRLVPLSLEGTPPPIGFRQFQSIDLGGWRGRGKVPRIEEILAAVERQSKEPGIPAPLGPGAVRRRRDGPSLNMWAVIVLLIAMFFVIVGLLIGRPWQRGSPRIPTVGVEASEPAAEPLARDLLVKLTTLQSARSSSMRLLGADQPDRQKADFIFHVSADSRAASPSASLMLVSGKDRSVLWSQDFKQDSGGLADLKQQTSFTAARVLGCALDGFSPAPSELKPALFKSYLNGCAQLDETFFDDTSQAVAILQQVTQNAPRFKPGWAKRLVAETNRYQGLTPEERKTYAPQLRSVITAARKLDPDMPEAYVAEIELLPGRDFYDQVRLIDRAVQIDPNNVFVRAARSLVMLCVGRMDSAVEDARHAASLDPISPAIRSSYLQALTYSGRTDTARSELAEAERLWPDASTILDSRYRLNLRYGNLAEAADAARLMQSGKVASGRVRDAFVRARLDLTKPNVDRAVHLATSAYQTHPQADTMGELIMTLGEFDRTGDLLNFLVAAKDEAQFPYFVELLFRPPLADLRADPRFMQVAAHLGLLDYWRRSGTWPDFCSEPDLPYDCKAEAAKLQ